MQAWVSVAAVCRKTFGRSSLAPKSWALATRSRSSVKWTMAICGRGAALWTYQRDLRITDRDQRGHLGVAFQPDTDDVRDSTALSVAGQLQWQVANVSIYDPKAMDNARKTMPTLDYAVSNLDACRGADIVSVLTEWKEFQNIEPGGICAVDSNEEHRRCSELSLYRGNGGRRAGPTAASVGRDEAHLR